MKVIQGLKVKSFFDTKKKTSPIGEEEGQIIPAAKESLMYTSMGSRSGLDRL